MIYVIGKKGFVAKRIKKYFSNKKKIFFLGSDKFDLTKKEINNIKIKPNSVIVFLSAITPDKGKDLLTFEKNICILTNFLNKINLSYISKFIYISSDAVYSLKNQKISDSTKPDPDDLYGLMHLTRENILKKIINKKKLLILRPTIMYGIGDTHNSYGPNRFINNLMNNEKIILFGKGMDVRDHLHVEDLVKIIFKVCTKKIFYGEFVVASQKSLKFINVAYKILTLFNLPKNSIDYIVVQNKISKRYFVNLKINKLLKFRFASLREGLNEYKIINKKIALKS